MNRFTMDASALSKRYVVEPGSSVMNYLFAKVARKRLLCPSICAAEAFSVIVRNRNRKRLTPDDADAALLALRTEVLSAAKVTLMPTNDTLIFAGLPFIERHNLNATDAAILRAAVDLHAHLGTSGDAVVLVAADERLLRAAAAEGIPAYDPEPEDLAALQALIG